jgi:hypothetical protein
MRRSSQADLHATSTTGSSTSAHLVMMLLLSFAFGRMQGIGTLIVPHARLGLSFASLKLCIGIAGDESFVSRFSLGVRRRPDLRRGVPTHKRLRTVFKLFGARQALQAALRQTRLGVNGVLCGQPGQPWFQVREQEVRQVSDVLRGLQSHQIQLQHVLPLLHAGRVSFLLLHALACPSELFFSSKGHMVPESLGLSRDAFGDVALAGGLFRGDT